MANSSTGRAVCVHVAKSSSSQEEVEFNFPNARFAIESGTLRVYSADEPPIDFMAFSADSWKAAWLVDPATGKPLGLADPSAKLNAAPDMGKQRSERVIELLASGPYVSLSDFSARAAMPEREVQKILTIALGQKKASLDAVALPEIQAALNAVMPEILAGSPSNYQEILSILAQRPATQACDMIQLRVWTMRNPSSTRSAAA